MSQRNPDYSIRDFMVVSSNRILTELTSTDRAQLWFKWARDDLHVPETASKSIGVAAELGSRALNQVSAGAHEMKLKLVAGIENVSDVYDDILSILPIKAMKKAVRDFKNDLHDECSADVVRYGTEDESMSFRDKTIREIAMFVNIGRSK